MATQSSILVWRIPWTEEPGGVQSTRWQRVRHDSATKQQNNIAYISTLWAGEKNNEKYKAKLHNTIGSECTVS